MRSSIRSMKRIRTYLQHPKKDVERHILVSSTLHDGFNPENNYTEFSETVVFLGWKPQTGSEILQHSHDAGIYAEHDRIVRELRSQGYRQVTRKVDVTPQDPVGETKEYSLAR
jgi:hypothetical protein